MVASAVMDLDAATGGRIRLTTTQARARQDDQNRDGIGLSDVKVIHDRTPSAPAFSYGPRLWPALRARLEAADGAIVTGRYGVLGSERAPRSTFTGRHAMYVQSIRGPNDRGTPGAVVNDPLRDGEAVISVGALQRFYLSGLIGAGWSLGDSSSGVSTPPRMVGAWLDQVMFPEGKIITQADIDSIMVTLNRNGWFSGAAGAIASPIFYQILLRDALGQPWNKALEDRLANDTGAAATGAGDPFGIATAVQAGVGSLITGISEVARNGILLVAILGIVIMGLWLVATAGDGIKIPLAPRISIGA